jgi:hypothetical protein
VKFLQDKGARKLKYKSLDEFFKEVPFNQDDCADLLEEYLEEKEATRESALDILGYTKYYYFIEFYTYLFSKFSEFLSEEEIEEAMARLKRDFNDAAIEAEGIDFEDLIF